MNQYFTKLVEDKIRFEKLFKRRVIYFTIFLIVLPFIYAIYQSLITFILIEIFILVYSFLIFKTLSARHVARLRVEYAKRVLDEADYSEIEDELLRTLSLNILDLERVHPYEIVKQLKKG